MPRFSVLRPLVQSILGLALVGGAVVAASCAKSTDGASAFNTVTLPDGAVVPIDDSGNAFNPFGGGDGNTLVVGSGCGGSICSDFNVNPNPILDTTNGSSVPSDVANQFGPAGSGGSSGGPCIYEPPPGALFPNNWLRPRFYWFGGNGQSLFELRFHSPNEQTDLVVYTSQTKWTMPASIWTSLAGDLQGAPITVSIRQMTSSGPVAGTSTNFIIAPAPAQGAMVFWSTNSFATNATSTDLQGFQVGDESTTTVLTPAQVQQKVRGQGFAPDGGALNVQPNQFNQVGCIGCHSSTPDGNYVGFTAQWMWPNAIASVQADAGNVGSQPPWLSNGAISNLSPNVYGAYLGGDQTGNPPQMINGGVNNVNDYMLGVQTFTKAHYSNGDHVEVTSLGAGLNIGQVNGQLQTTAQQTNVVSQLIWVNLEWNPAGGATDPAQIDAGLPNAAPGAANNGGWGVLARTGDSNGAGTPTWSHDGNNIAYTSVNAGTEDGRLGAPSSGTADVKIIPYSAFNGMPGGAGGMATSLQGASDSAYNEYFPGWSPDDQLIAFDRVASGNTMYQQPLAEVYVVPASGGQATRLAGNSPAMCVGKSSPGVQNTWPKWAPAPAGGQVKPAADGKLYYWVTFSSLRMPNDPNNPASTGNKTQLFIAGVSVDPNNNNTIATFPAIYLWNQDPTNNNLIPAWDNFAIPSASGGPPR